MSLVVFTGGARSGKSRAAQELARRRALEGERVVVAVFGRESDSEMADRVARHRAHRPGEFETIVGGESPRWLDDAGEALLVVDCLGTFVGTVIENVWRVRSDSALGDAGDVLPDGVADEVESSVLGIVERLLSRRGDTIVVTNEVGDGVVPAFASGRLFRDVLGVANRVLVDDADRAYLCVAGRLLDLADLPRTATWPHD